MVSMGDLNTFDCSGMGNKDDKAGNGGSDIIDAEPVEFPSLSL